MKAYILIEKKGYMMINKILEFYGEDAKVDFISNRINNYSVDPNNWVRTHTEYNFMVTSAIKIKL